MKALTEFFGNSYPAPKEEPKKEAVKVEPAVVIPAAIKVEPPKPSTAQKPKTQRKKRTNGSSKQTNKKQ